MPTFLTLVGSIFTQFVTWLSTLISFITSPGNEILYIFVLLAVVTVVMRMLRRWIPGL